MFFGFLSTFLLTETKDRSLESLSNERQARFAAGDTGEDGDGHEMEDLVRSEVPILENTSFPDDGQIQEIPNTYPYGNGAGTKAKQRYQRGYAEVHTDIV